MVFRDDIIVFMQAGALPASALEQVIAAARALDMDDVRRQIAEQQSGAGAEPKSA
jgi:thioredoxin 1